MGARQVGRARPLVVTVFGTRPQFIKLAVLWRPLEERFRSVLIDSGQHYDWELAGVMHADTGLRLPDLHLGVGSSSPAAQIGRVADALDARLARLRPQTVIVFGDTSTTAGAAIAAAYRGIPVAHIEAGMRSFDRSAPEEKNRLIADHLARWRFCPTRTAMANLRREGMRDGLHAVGDLMYEHWLGQRPSLSPPAELPPGGYYYVTTHRAENVDAPERLRSLVRILSGLDAPTVWPVHPRTRKRLTAAGLWQRLRKRPNLMLLPPVPHSRSLALTAGARMVLTDSGGVQREAYWSGVPCLILRDVTEWVELLDCGAARLVGLDARRARAAIDRRWIRRPVTDRIFRQRAPSRVIVRTLARDLARS
ncbi:MAG TPA: UDP-N-acetylglucosamine 2-epimerase (non-hydrolyzing) [bacterium]|nr:UDP-N-acetylglucosamine 2-epimerase (non-hydrolyzing) [bacterium]